MKRAAILVGLLGGCVPSDASPPPDGVLPGTPIEIDGRTLVAQQMRNWPVMIWTIASDRGDTVVSQSGTGDTVIISGSADSRDRAIAALAQFCNRPEISPAGFDTQFVYQDPANGDWWFDGFLCEG